MTHRTISGCFTMELHLALVHGRNHWIYKIIKNKKLHILPFTPVAGLTLVIVGVLSLDA